MHDMEKPVPVLINAERRWAFKSDLEKAEIFVYSFPASKQRRKPKCAMPMSHPIKPTTPKEVSKMIKNLRMKKKAPGYDLITSKLLKNLSKKKAAVFPMSLFNAAYLERRTSLIFGRRRR